jgi:hypothetical protein
MKTLLAIGSFLLPTLLLVANEANPFAEENPFAKARLAPERPERMILKLPKSITHRELKASMHEYTISGIYRGAAAKSMDPKESASNTKIMIPDALDLDFDFKLGKATFSTTRKLSLSELAYAIDDMAELGGDIPYWAELEARDLQRTKQFARLRYTIKATDEIPPDDLAWFWIPRDREFRMPLITTASDLGNLLVLPSTAYCMCHSRFSLRILDSEGEVIWEDQDTAYAWVKIAIANDPDEPGTHKIWLTRDDHGESAQFLIRGHFLHLHEIEPTGAGQPAPRPLDEPGGGDKPQPEAEGRSR